MKPRDTHPNLPVHDFTSAIQNALLWLDDRYLLATPVVRRRHNPRIPALYLQSGPWLPVDKRRS
jgi:hypothetical protein